LKHSGFVETDREGGKKRLFPVARSRIKVGVKIAVVMEGRQPINLPVPLTHRL